MNLMCAVLLLMTIPAGICVLVYLAVALLKRQYEARMWREAEEDAAIPFDFDPELVELPQDTEIEFSNDPHNVTKYDKEGKPYVVRRQIQNPSAIPMPKPGDMSTITKFQAMEHVEGMFEGMPSDPDSMSNHVSLILEGIRTRQAYVALKQQLFAELKKLEEKYAKESDEEFFEATKQEGYLTLDSKLKAKLKKLVKRKPAKKAKRK